MYLHQPGSFPPTPGQVGYAFYHHSSPDIGYVKEDDFHVLSVAEKKKIFAENAPHHDRAVEMGRSILARLSKLAPDVASSFTVKSNPVDDLTMRLWCPSREPGDPINSYYCLSYCRNFDNPMYIVGAREVKLPLSSLLGHAFATLRTKVDEGLWIDEVCINQRNAQEKSIAIGAMDTVYRCAKAVFVTLQDVEVNVEQQAFLRHQVTKHGSTWWLDDKGEVKHVNDDPPFLETYPVMKRFVYTILGSRYFTRARCSHELQMRNRPGDVGSTGMDFTEVDRITTLKDKLLIALQAHKTEKKSQSIGTSLPKRDFRSLSYPARIREIIALDAGGDPLLAPPLRQSSIIIDKTTIILNILGNGLRTTRKIGEPVTEVETLKELNILGLAANDPLVLCTMGPYMKFTPQGHLSWLRKPVYIDRGCSYDCSVPLPPMSQRIAEAISIDPSGEQRWIRLDVFALGRPQPHSKKSQTIAKSLVDKCLSLRMGRFVNGIIDEQLDKISDTGNELVDHLVSYSVNAANGWGVGPQYQYWYSQTFFAQSRERFVWTVAIILHCGKAWILGTAQKCGYPAVSPATRNLDAYFGIGDGWDLDELGVSLWYEIESGRLAVDIILWLANWVVSWGCDLPYGRDAEHMPTIYDHGPRGLGYAVVFIRGDALLQVLVPCVLMSDSYSHLYRVWLAGAKDDPFYDKIYQGIQTEWFLRAKAILFTDVKDIDIEFSAGSAGDGKPGWRFHPGVQIHGPPDFVGEEIHKNLKTGSNAHYKKQNPASSGSGVVDTKQTQAIATNFEATGSGTTVYQDSSHAIKVQHQNPGSSYPSNKSSEVIEENLKGLVIDNTESGISSIKSVSQQPTSPHVPVRTQTSEHPAKHQTITEQPKSPQRVSRVPPVRKNEGEDDDMAWAKKAWKRTKTPAPKR